MKRRFRKEDIEGVNVAVSLKDEDMFFEGIVFVEKEAGNSSLFVLKDETGKAVSPIFNTGDIKDFFIL